MKKSILLFFTTVITLSIFAQSNNTNVKKHEIGINATSFIKEFLSLNTSDVDEGAYMVTYKKLNENNTAFRLGLGGQISQMNENLEGGGKLETKDNLAALRVGFEWQKNISSRWNVYYGLDAITDFGQEVSNTVTFLNSGQIEEVELRDQSIAFGGGPILGIQFFISENISLSTEGSLYARYNTLNEKELFKVQTQANKDETSTSTRLDFGLPTALFFVIRF